MMLYRPGIKYISSFLLLSSFFLTPELFAQPKGVHLSWNGKKKVNTTKTIGITWMNEMQGKGQILYGVDSNNLNKGEKTKRKYSNDLKTYVHKATLKKLKPGTFYYYRAGSDASGWSSVYRFRTGPGKNDHSKIVVGIWSDTQNNKGNLEFEQTDSMVSALKKNTFHFTLHNGDIVENGSMVKSWKKFFDVAEPLNSHYPFMSVTGNHDVVNDTASPAFQKPFPVYYDLFNLPNDQLNYSYNYGNVHFVAINSGYAQGAEKVGKVLFAEGSQEYKWLDADLAKAKKTKHIDWIIVYSHYPIYSFGFSHVPTWQKHLKPLVDKYEVDLYLAGHRHVYERHKAVRGSEIFEQTAPHIYKNPKGTVYITNGSCGGSLQGTGGDKLPTMAVTPKEKIYTYSIMSIENKTINYSVYDQTGKQIDYFRIMK